MMGPKTAYISSPLGLTITELFLIRKAEAEIGRLTPSLDERKKDHGCLFISRRSDYYDREIPR